jgi:hypothetical protein
MTEFFTLMSNIISIHLWLWVFPHVSHTSHYLLEAIRIYTVMTQKNITSISYNQMDLLSQNALICHVPIINWS